MDITFYFNWVNPLYRQLLLHTPTHMQALEMWISSCTNMTYIEASLLSSSLRGRNDTISMILSELKNIALDLNGAFNLSHFHRFLLFPSRQPTHQMGFKKMFSSKKKSCKQNVTFYLIFLIP